MVVPKLLLTGLLGLVTLPLLNQSGFANPAPRKTAGLHYILNEYQKSESHCVEAKAQLNCTSIKFSYPEFQGNNNQDSEITINQSLLTSLLKILQSSEEDPLPEDLAALMDQFLKDNREIKQEFPEHPHWVSETVVKVIQNSDRFVSLEISNYSYTGGAHSNSNTHYQNFSTDTGKQIHLSDLFKEGYKPLLRKTAEARFRAARSLSPEISLDEAGFWFENNQFQLNDNFALGKTGLIFSFNSYEVAPYALGPTTFEIPYSELTHIMKAQIK